MHPYISLLTTQQSFSRNPIEYWPNNSFRLSASYIIRRSRWAERQKIVYSLCLPSVPYINGSCPYLCGTDRAWMRNRMKYVILKCFCGVFRSERWNAECLGYSLFICCSVCLFSVFWVKKCCEMDILKKLSSFTLRLTRGYCLVFCFSIALSHVFLCSVHVLDFFLIVVGYLSWLSKLAIYLFIKCVNFAHIFEMK